MAIAECLAVGLAIQVTIEEGYEQVKIEADAKSVLMLSTTLVKR